ncbi:MAG: hydrogenase [Candidatus Thorarchaeota archaeon]|nr:hydrogenase [Candidatus Thorarchaeota archaeon]
MLPGKVPPDVLIRSVFPFLGSDDRDVILGPSIGRDASLIRVGDTVFVVSTDPVTGSVEDIGWIAVNVNANDIATFGVRPRWFLLSVLLPPGSTPQDLERIMRQVHEASLALGVSVVGGHSEVTEGLGRPIITGFMIGVTKEGAYVTSSGARPGDVIVLTKTVGLEGTSILCTEGRDVLHKHLPYEVVQAGMSLRSMISVVKDGTAAYSTGLVTAMHDPTEGGVYGGIHEICDASGTGCEIDSTTIPLHPATERLCHLLNIDPLGLISSGCMLMTCPSQDKDRLVQALTDAGIPTTCIGRVTADAARRVMSTGDATRSLPRPLTDELWVALRRMESLRTS